MLLKWLSKKLVLEEDVFLVPVLEEAEEPDEVAVSAAVVVDPVS